MSSARPTTLTPQSSYFFGQINIFQRSLKKSKVQKDKISFFNWMCKECKTGTCHEVNLSDDYIRELKALNDDMKLEEVELDILEVLFSEQRDMRAGEVSALIDKSHQLVGWRTTKLQENDLVNKECKNNITVNKITERAIEIYFSDKT